MIANNAQSTASVINELCINNWTFDAWIELITVLTRKNIIKERKLLILTQINLTLSQHSTTFL